jgi:hypothetical protein
MLIATSLGNDGYVVPLLQNENGVEHGRHFTASTNGARSVWLPEHHRFSKRPREPFGALLSPRANLARKRDAGPLNRAIWS